MRYCVDARAGGDGRCWLYGGPRSSRWGGGGDAGAIRKHLTVTILLYVLLYAIILRGGTGYYVTPSIIVCTLCISVYVLVYYEA